MTKLQTILEQKQIHWGWLFTGGVLAILGGMVAIGSPFLMGVGIGFLVGWMMVAAGFYYLLYTIETRHERHLFRKALMTILYFAAGLFMVTNPVQGLVSLTLLMGVIFLVEGLTSISMLFSPKIQSRRAWLAFSSLVEIGLGLYVLFGLPSASRWLIGTLWGVHMVILGFSLLAVAMNLNRRHSHTDPIAQPLAA
ncbi:MAG: DUF308 domain-containing protein [Deltaproteobacteria bacterium]|nr:DUF308 domain-containing protein [Deltaproteobacteria bacterium]